jgi:hypothetical protein
VALIDCTVQYPFRPSFPHNLSPTIGAISSKGTLVVQGASTSFNSAPARCAKPSPASPAVPPQKKSAPESAQSAEVERPKLLANGAGRKEEEPLAWCRSVVSAVLHGLFQLCFSRCAPAARPFDASAERVGSALIHSFFRKVFWRIFAK